MLSSTLCFEASRPEDSFFGVIMINTAIAINAVRVATPNFLNAMIFLQWLLLQTRTGGPELAFFVFPTLGD
jgi:hypothetical protein